MVETGASRGTSTVLRMWEPRAIGASMGGMIAQHIALDHRDRVTSLVLACTTPGGRSGAPPWQLLVASALRPFFGSKRTFPVVAPVLYAQQTRDERPDRLREDLD